MVFVREPLEGFPRDWRCQFLCYTANTAAASLQSPLPRRPLARTCTRYWVPGTMPSMVTRICEPVSVKVYDSRVDGDILRVRSEALVLMQAGC